MRVLFLEFVLYYRRGGPITLIGDSALLERRRMFEASFFRPDDVWELPLYLGEEMAARMRAAILEHCFGVIAYAWYQVQTAEATVPFPVLMSISCAGGGYVLSLGSGVCVEFRTLEELRAILPTVRGRARTWL